MSFRPIASPQQANECTPRSGKPNAGTSNCSKAPYGPFGRMSGTNSTSFSLTSLSGRTSKLGIALIWALILSLLPQADFVPGSGLRTEVASAQTDTAPEDEVVFIDSQGFIQVWDPNVLAGTPEVNWVSPEGGFTDITLGDVNNDGDQEIIGINWNGIVGRLVVYDPVLNSRSLTEDGLSLSGIPWRKLADITLPGEPKMVDAGDLDQGVNGDEIAYGVVVGNSTIVAVLKGTAVEHEGTEWAVHIQTTFPFTWNSLTVGNSDGIGTDEIILTDTGNGTKDDRSKLHIYRVDTDSLVAQSPIFKKSSTNNKWRGVAVGEMKKGGAPETVAYRSVTGAGTLTVFLFQYRPDDAGDPDASFNEAEGDGIEMLRRPHWAFMADVNGPVNGVQDFEAFFLREVKEGETAKDRLLVENRGDDSIDKEKVSLELDLASNWRRGEGGNINGSADGREEIVLMGTNKLRVYSYSASGDNHLKLSQERAINTNEKSLRLGDLDAIGFASGVLLSVETPVTDLEVLSGSRAVFTFDVKGSSDGVPINVVVDTSVPWITRVTSGNNITPSTYLVEIDASNLLPGSYSIPVSITSSDADVSNAPLSTGVDFVVAPARVTVSPDAANYAHFPCSGPPTDQEFVLNITGSTGINYSAAVLDQPDFQRIEGQLTGNSLAGSVNAAGVMEISDSAGNRALLDDLMAPRIAASEVITWSSPDWIQAVSAKGTINNTGTTGIPSDTMNITIKASELPTTTTAAIATLILVSDQRTGSSPDNLMFVPIRYICAAAKVSLPIFYPVGNTAIQR